MSDQNTATMLTQDAISGGVSGDTGSSVQTTSVMDTTPGGIGMVPSWTAQDLQLKSMWESGDPPQKIADVLGRSVAAVMTRAARLGLPRRFAPGRKPLPKVPGERIVTRTRMAAMAITRPDKQVVTSLRVCLMCLSKFQSAGPHNRICGGCRESPEYTAGSRLPDLDFPV